VWGVYWQPVRAAILAFAGLSAAGAAWAQTPTIASVVNSASLQPALAPGVLATVLGANLADGTCGTTAAPLLTRLCNAQVTVNGVACPILRASAGQLNIQFPTDLQPGTYPLVVERAGVRSSAVNVKVDALAPGLFTVTPTLGAFTHSDGSPVTILDPAGAGEVILCQAVGLGPTTPSIAAGAASPFAPLAVTNAPVAVTVGGQAAAVLFSGLTPGQVGLYQVNFSVPQGLAPGNQPFLLNIGGSTSNAVALPVGLRPPQVTGVVNGASFGPAAVAAPGSILSIFGGSFGFQYGDSLFPATAFQGVSVTFNGTAAPLFAVSGGQINVLAPTELPETGNVTVQVKNNVGASANFTLRMAPAAPGIFVLPDPSEEGSRRNAAAVFANTKWLAMPTALARALEIPENCRAGGVDPRSTCGQPALPGDFLQVFVTGLGRATPNGDPAGQVLPSGAAAPGGGNPLYRTVVPPTVTIGGVPAGVQFSGLAPGFAGLYQVNVQVPNSAPAGDDVPIRITLPDGSTDGATIAVARP
jgi:uncharacterized protein (TIGR03437 family)